MCGARPCCSSVCGLELRVAVITIGGAELLLTLVATVLNLAKYASHYTEEGYSAQCRDRDVCFGNFIYISYHIYRVDQKKVCSQKTKIGHGGGFLKKKFMTNKINIKKFL